MKQFLPDIHVSDISASIIALEEDVAHAVPKSGWSALYVARQEPFFVQTSDGQPVRIEPGSLACIPSGKPHNLSARGLWSEETWAGPPPPHALTSSAEPPSPTLSSTTLSSQRKASVEVFRFNVPNTTNPLPDLVPTLIVWTKSEINQAKGLRPILDLLQQADIIGEPEEAAISQRLAEIVAIHLTRRVLKDLEERGLNAKAGVSERRIRRAVQAIHHTPDRNWTLEDLAREAGISRSGLAQHFKDNIGVAPIAYLTRIRIDLAAGYLQSTEWSIANITHKVGYQSEAAFSKAFKRQFGLSPGRYRLIARS